MAPNKYALNAFEEAVQQALKHYHDPVQLGNESPLAAPYFLWQALRPQSNATNAALRGETLRTEIRHAAASLWGDSLPKSTAEMQAALLKELAAKETPRYAYLILELHYFQQYLRPRTLNAIYEEYLHLSKPSYYRYLNLAIQLMSQALLARLHPTLRPEQPRLPAQFVGYTAQVEQCLSALNAHKSVAIIGPGGAGKTTLATAVAQALAPRPLFWFTFRTTLNDHLDSLLVALGHFLAEQGATSTWQFILAAGGRIDNYHLATTLVQQDLAHLYSHLPLLCFDELDRLHAIDADHANPAHSQLLEFIESISQATPLLLIGQRSVIECNVTIKVNGLPPLQVHQLVAAAGLMLPPAEVTQLAHYTQGNPRLLLLFVALHQQGEAIATTLAELPQAPELRPILGRLWKRLGQSERTLLQQLAVFRTFAPDDSWPQAYTPLTILLDLRLLQQDGYGGVQILPVLREWIYQEIAQEEREQHHLTAALIRQQRAEYTAAAYHFGQAGYVEQAIQVWYPQLAWEIQRGQADAARAIFLHLSQRGLGETEQKALGEIRGLLHQLRGDNEAGLAVVERVAASKAAQPTPSEVNVRLKILQGRFLQALGHPYTALESYDDALNTLARLQQQMNETRYRRSKLHMDQREFTQAWHEVHAMEYQLYNLQGQLYNESGDFDAACAVHQQALQLAQTLQDEQRVAETHFQLAIVYGHQHQIDAALAQAKAALSYYERVKNFSRVATIHNNLAASYINSGNYPAAIDAAQRSLTFFRQTKDPYRIALTATNLAECYFEIGDHKKAEQYAYEAIAQEEPHTYPYVYLTLGRVRRSSHQYKEAHAYFQEAIQIARRNQEPYIEAFIWQELGRLHLEQGATVEAATALNKALSLFNQLGIIDKVTETQMLLQSISEAVPE